MAATTATLLHVVFALHSCGDVSFRFLFSVVHFLSVRGVSRLLVSHGGAFLRLSVSQVLGRIGSGLFGCLLCLLGLLVLGRDS